MRRRLAPSSNRTLDGDSLVPARLVRGTLAGTLIAACLAFAGAATPPVLAQVPDTQDPPAVGGTEAEAGSDLPRLYDQLAGSDTELEARAVEQLIIAQWHRSGSPTVDLLLQRGIAAMEEEEYGLANELFDTVVVLRPDFAEGWNRRATLYYLINEYEHSLSDISRVLALEPKHFGALSGMGLILQEIGRDDDALAAFRAALDVHPYLNNARNAADELERTVEGQEI
ncbi:MAG: tetratricopeptide repeat protein [Pseudomonadota bacterium]